MASMSATRPSGNALAVDLQDVSLVYPTSRGPLTALEGLSFSVQPGEFVSVLGPSGCGKSSLLRLVSGLRPATRGQVRVGGSAVAAPRRDVGIVFQQPTLLPWKTVLDNVLVPIRAMGLDAGATRDRALAMIELVGLKSFATHYPRELSGGMQQRVAVARGLVQDPGLLLMDEPFAALDAMTREQMMSELQRIWAETGKTVLFITHSIPEAVFLSDRIIVMSGRPGRVVGEYKVPVPRPRTDASMSSPAFVALADELRRAFNELHRAPEIA